MFFRGYGGSAPCWGFANGFFHGGLGMLIMAAILIGTGFLIFKMVKRRNNNQHSMNALEQLKFRYANGQLTEEEYNQKKKVLEQ
ncbi:putative membrane protein [Tindallia magadiensis]|uniref:Putative membrane protein n=1 Tax=Tindallia magadiensis TaxID=69895 RepID=A0A1I3DC09_9FIRM|nr:SHOCT domain-containing protein [Tindallia magadiensis]SFH84243.1 putative membrane protein [Tindallia magadiensis]